MSNDRTLVGDLEELRDNPFAFGNDTKKERLNRAIVALSRLQAQESREAEPAAYGFPNTAVTGSGKSLMMVALDIPSDDQYQGKFWIPLYTSKQALSAETDKIELSAEVEARIDDRAEAAYWAFDAARKGLGEWKDRPQAERDAFKSQFRKYMRAERQSAKMMLRIQKSEQAP